ncbi:hypothetical protein D3C80_1971310 [compost metagenome]
MALRGAIGEVLEQQQDIVVPLAQRRNAQAGDVQAVIKVGTEAAFVGGQAQIFLGGGDDTDIQGNKLVGAETLHHPLL